MLIQSYEKIQLNAVRWPSQTGKSADFGVIHLADARNIEIEYNPAKILGWKSKLTYMALEISLAFHCSLFCLCLFFGCFLFVIPSSEFWCRGATYDYPYYWIDEVWVIAK